MVRVTNDNSALEFASRAVEKIHSHVELIFKGPLHEKDEQIKMTYLLLRVGDKDRNQ